MSNGIVQVLEPEVLTRKLATLVREMRGWTGDARLYRLSEPLATESDRVDFVVVSGTHAMFSGPETYIFAADESGEVLSWTELDGSFRGDIDHARALAGAGYEVTS